MVRHGLGLLLFFLAQPVQIFAKYLLHNGVVVYAKTVCSSAGIYQPFRSYFSCQAKDTCTRLISLFWMLLALHDQIDVPSQVFMYSPGLFYKLLRCPVRDIAMSRCKVLVLSSVM